VTRRRCADWISRLRSTRPAKDDWLLDADATVYPGTTTRIALVRHHLRQSGNDWQGTTGDIEIGPPIGTNTTGQQQEGPLCV